MGRGEQRAGPEDAGWRAAKFVLIFIWIHGKKAEAPHFAVGDEPVTRRYLSKLGNSIARRMNVLVTRGSVNLLGAGTSVIMQAALVTSIQCFC